MRLGAALLPLVVLAPAFSGCAAEPEDLPSAIRSQLQALVEGDVDRFMRYIGEVYVDGQEGAQTRFAMEQKFRRYFGSDEWEKDRAIIRDPAEYYNWEALLVLTAQEYRDITGANVSDRFRGYEPDAEDRYANLPPISTRASPDAWEGWYRPENRRWEQVAGPNE